MVGIYLSAYLAAIGSEQTMIWWQYVGAVLTGSTGAALINVIAQQRGMQRFDRHVSQHDQTVDRQRLFQEATDLIDGMRLEIDRLRRDVVAIRSECELRQSRLENQVETMNREVTYWQQVAGELRRDNAHLRSEIGRLQNRLDEVEHQKHETIANNTER